MEKKNTILKVSSTSKPTAVAGAIAGIFQNSEYTVKRVELRAIGAGAVNQAAKAIAIARGFVAPSGIDLVCVPGFLKQEQGNDGVSIIRFIIEQR